MAHVPVEPDPAAVAATAPAEPEPTQAPTDKILYFKMHVLYCIEKFISIVFSIVLGLGTSSILSPVYMVGRWYLKKDKLAIVKEIRQEFPLR